MKVLWLASWYPDEYEPTNGDFIQRHAQAVSQLMHVDVIHVAQAGRSFNHLNKVEKKNNGSLHEAIYYFIYKKFNIDWVNKFLYNITYRRYYKKVIKKYIEEKGKPDLLHVHVPIKAGIIALAFYKKLKIPFIISEHSSLYLKESANSFYTRNFYFKFYTKRIFKNAKLVTNVSASIAKVLQEMFALKDVRIIPNVVDTNHFYFKPKEKNKVFRWLHVSSMVPLKNIDQIIIAFNNSSEKYNSELIITGPVKKEYETLVAQLNLQHKIFFTGELSYADVAKQMQRADAFIMFSKHENFPCVIIEALCCGLPIVSSNVGGIAEAVNASNGILVQPNNLQDLQNAIISMQKNISNYNSEQIAAAASAKYNYTTVAKQFVSVYKEVLHQP